MTSVCLRCGWLVIGGGPCKRDGGPSVEWRSAARACRAPSLRRLLNLEPRVRLAWFMLDRDLRLEGNRHGRPSRAGDRETA